jgi:predicted MFS family arabinose efflux permease
VIGQILSGALISVDVAGTQWRAIFLINVPIGAAAIAGARRHLPPGERLASQGIDLLGVALMSASVLLVVLPLVLGRAEGWPRWTWICLAASVPTFALFVIAERWATARSKSPLVNLHVIARPAVAWSFATLLVATGTYYALLFTLAQYLQHGLGHDALVSGLTLVPWVAAFGLAGQLVRRLPAGVTPIVPALGCLLLATAYAAISIVSLTGHAGETLLTTLLGLGGFGLGIQFSALIGHVTSAVPADYAPDISGVTTTTTQVGGAIGVAAFGTLYLGAADGGAPHAMHAFGLVTAAFAAAALVATVTARRATAQRRLGAM